MAGSRNGAIRRWISSWCWPAQAGGHPPPEDPPLGPALHVFLCLHALVEDRPEGLEADLVERKPRPGPEREAGEVEPARLVLRALDPLVGQVAERLPERPQGRGGPLVARDVEQFLEPLDQPRRAALSELAAEAAASNAARIAAIAASSSDCSMITRSVSSPVTVAAPAGCAGRAAKLDLQPPAAVVGARLAPELDGADLGHPRRQAHGHALGLRLAADPHQALERRQLADRVGVGGHQVARLVVGPDRAAGQREDDRLAHQQVEVVAGRSRSRRLPARRGARRTSRAWSACSVSSPT